MQVSDWADPPLRDHSKGTWEAERPEAELGWGHPGGTVTPARQAPITGYSVYLIPMTSQQPHEEGTTIDRSHLPRFTEMSGRARVKVRPLAPSLRSGLCEDPPPDQTGAFHNSD